MHFVDIWPQILRKRGFKSLILQLDEHSLCCLKVSRMVEDDIGKKDNLLGLNNQLRGSNRYPNIYSNEDLCLKV